MLVLTQTSNSCHGRSPKLRRRLLAVDDCPDFLEIVARIIKTRSLPLDFRLARDGQEGLEAYQSFAADALLINFMMPRMDGLELCRRVRLISPAPRRPIIILDSCCSREKIEAAALDAGADLFLPLPCEMQELTSLLHAAAGP